MRSEKALYLNMLCADADFFDIVTEVLQEGILPLYLFVLNLDYVLRTSIDLIKENGFILKKAKSRQYPANSMTNQDYTVELAFLVNTLAQAESQLHSLEKAAEGIGLYVNANKIEYIGLKQKGAIFTL